MLSGENDFTACAPAAPCLHRSDARGQRSIVMRTNKMLLAALKESEKATMSFPCVLQLNNPWAFCKCFKRGLVKVVQRWIIQTGVVDIFFGRRFWMLKASCLEATSSEKRQHIMITCELSPTLRDGKDNRNEESWVAQLQEDITTLFMEFPRRTGKKSKGQVQHSPTIAILSPRNRVMKSSFILNESPLSVLIKFVAKPRQAQNRSDLNGKRDWLNSSVVPESWKQWQNFYKWQWNFHHRGLGRTSISNLRLASYGMQRYASIRKGFRKFN